MVTISDVADLAGVGVGTVSRVINDSPKVSDATRQRVQAAIAELDYHPNPMARGLSRGITQTIGLIVPFFTEPSFVERLRGVTSVVNASEWDLVLYSIESRAQRDQRLRSFSRPDLAAGYLVVSIGDFGDEREAVIESGLPVVHVDGRIPGVQSYHVDNELGGFLAGDHLLGLGHRRIAYVGDPNDAPFGYSPAADRLEGLRRACSAVGIEPQLGTVRNGRDGHVDAIQVTRAMMTADDRPTAVFASSDVQALGVIKTARQMGLRVPDDLSVIGFDNIEMTTYVGLTTIDQALYDSGRLAAQWLVDALCGSVQAGSEAVELAVTLVERSTTGPPPAD